MLGGPRVAVDKPVSDWFRARLLSLIAHCGDGCGGGVDETIEIVPESMIHPCPSTEKDDMQLLVRLAISLSLSRDTELHPRAAHLNAAWPII